MTSPIASLNQHATIGEATEFFIDARINSAPVVDDEGQLVGILSEKDILWNILRADCWRQPVGEIMQRSVISYPEDTPLLKIFAFLCRASIRRVVIVRDNKPLGVISRGSLLRWFLNWARTRGENLHGQVHSSSGVVIDQPQMQLLDMASSLSMRAEQLVAVLSREEPGGDLLAPLVSGASNIQEMTNDLLAFSHKINLIAAASRHGSVPAKVC